MDALFLTRYLALFPSQGDTNLSLFYTNRQTYKTFNIDASPVLEPLSLPHVACGATPVLVRHIWITLRVLFVLFT